MFNLLQKINYYKGRLGLFDGNKRNYARGFVNGSSCNFKKSHYIDTKEELSYLYKELRTAKTESDRKDIMESICNCKGCLRGYEEKNKTLFVRKTNK